MASNQNQPQGNQPQGDKSGRGFASMSPDKQREIASKGGQAAHQKGSAHEFNSNEAREAGRKGSESRSAGTQSGNNVSRQSPPKNQ